MSRRQRAAISQAEIRKRCKLYGPLMEGIRAFRKGLSAAKNPYNPVYKAKEHRTWFNGWYMGKLKMMEKEDA